MNDVKKIVLNVEGMSCAHCVSAVEGAVKNLSGVETVKVSLDNKSATVDFDETKLSVDNIKEAIEDQGFDVVS